MTEHKTFGTVTAVKKALVDQGEYKADSYTRA